MGDELEQVSLSQDMFADGLCEATDKAMTIKRSAHLNEGLVRVVGALRSKLQVMWSRSVADIRNG